MSEQVKESPTGELEQGEFKVKKKRGRPKKLSQKSEPIKLDLAKKEEIKETQDAVQESSTGNVDEDKSTGNVEKVEERKSDTETQPVTETQKENQEEVIVEEITADSVEETKEVVEDIKQELKENPKLELPENVEKLVDFMKDTGGTVEDYVRLNADYKDINDHALLREYYKNTKPHLDQEEVNFLMEDNFSYDEDMDEERDVKKKKLALKEEVAKARGFLESLKGKYYEEIKLRPGVTQEQKKATDFFNRYNKEQEAIKKQHSDFKNTTKDYFSKDFKGFEFNLGEKRFRYNVKNPNEVSDAQSNLSTFIKKFLHEDGSINDHVGYHKAIYAARNADTIAKHFYDQGKADATKSIVSKSKNISNSSRPEPNGEVFINGYKVKAISGVDSSKLKIKKRK